LIAGKAYRYPNWQCRDRPFAKSCMDAQGGIGYSKLLLMRRSNEMKHGVKEAEHVRGMLGAAYGLAVYLRQGVERWWFLERNCAR